MSDTNDLPLADKLAMVVGGGLVLFGVTVMGTLETLLGSAHSVPQTNEAGEVVAHTTFAPNLRAAIIALGLVVFFLYGLYKVATAIADGSEPSFGSSGEAMAGD